MIIRMSLCRDNDFTHRIEEFCLDADFWGELNLAFNLTGGLFPTWNLKWKARSCEEFDACDKIEQKKHTIFADERNGKKYKKSDPEYKEICNEVRRLWIEWNKYRNKQLPNDLDVSIQYSITEHDDNGEVCYYFSRIGQCVIM